MLHRIKNLLTDNAIFIAIAITIAIAILSLIKLNGSTIPVVKSDKVAHSIAYFTLAISWLYTIYKNNQFQKLVWRVIIACFIYGTIIEILQAELTTYRTASGLDILANSIGIILAILVFHLFEKKIRLI